jgi:hypothetical protein
MNLSSGHTAFPRGKHTTSGAGGTLGGAANAGPAHPGYQVGSVGFGPNWTMEDSMAASIVRLECEADELRAEVALAEAERIELAKQLRSEREIHAACQNERDALAESVREFAGVIEGGQRHCDSEAYATPSDLSPRTTLETVAFLRKFNLWRRGGYDQQPPRAHEVGEAIDAACDHIERMEREIEGLRDALCGYKCADKSAADGGWSNI